MFTSPAGDVRVSVWAMPVPDQYQDAFHGAYGRSLVLVPWIEHYCGLATNPCVGIRDRAVNMCLEHSDCHPALLVPFQEDVQAFFTGGNFSGRLVVAAVWRPETDPSTAPYGGSKQLLEAFLSTMAPICEAGNGPHSRGPGCD